MNPEEKARVQIDAMLVASGWVVQNYTAVDFSANRGIALREVPLTTGPCDYLLLVDRKAVGVVEAKKAGTTLSTVADQSARYASSLPDLLKHGLTGVLPFLMNPPAWKPTFAMNAILRLAHAACSRSTDRKHSPTGPPSRTRCVVAWRKCRLLIRS